MVVVPRPLQEIIDDLYDRLDPPRMNARRTVDAEVSLDDSHFVTEDEAPALAPVQSVDGQRGDVESPVQSVNGKTGEVVITNVGGVDPRRSLNRMAVAIARVEFEQGLDMLDYSDGQYEIYAIDDNVESTTAVEIEYGAATDDEGFVELSEGETVGEVEHLTVDMGVIPDTAVHVDEVEALPDDADISYRLTDQNGNTVEIDRADLDSEIDLSEHIETFGVSVTATLSRSEEDGESPVLDSWSLYLTGDVPDEDFFDLSDIETVVEDEDYFDDGVSYETSNYELQQVS